MKFFIITIDTEGDNFWAWSEGMPITTKNATFLTRFQDTCDKYDFKPTWLVNWEMINDSVCSESIKKWIAEQRCEAGIHLHAWNTPPYHELPQHKNSGLPYLIEYPDEIMEKKLISIIRSFKEVFGFYPTTHRAGRWGMDNRYFRLLNKHGIKVDCSVTPYVDWTDSIGQSPNSFGTDYSMEKPYISYKEGVFEVPVSTMLSYKRFTATARKNQKENPSAFSPRVFWLRPMGGNLKSMKYLINHRSSSKIDYLEFMIHSSELMPGGSPTFNTEEDIEVLYEHLEHIFSLIAKDYRGVGLEEYWHIKTGEKNEQKI